MTLCALVAMFFARTGNSIAEPPRPAPVLIDHPPEHIGHLLKRLKADASLVRDAAVKELSGLDDAEPFVRVAADSASGAEKQALLQALAAIHRRIDARNVERAKSWVRDGRLDLVVDFLSRCDTDAAVAVADRLIGFTGEMKRSAERLMPDGGAGPRRIAPFPFKDYRQFSSMQMFARIHEEDVEIPYTVHSNVFARVGRCRLGIGDKNAWLLCSRDAITDGDPARTTWFNSIILVNGRYVLPEFKNSLLVCDEDLDLHQSCRVVNSVLVVRGTIRSKHRARVEGSFVWAGSTIEAPASVVEGSACVSRGKIAVDPASLTNKGNTFKADNPETKTAVRFLELTDVGIDGELADEGLRVNAVKDGSALARQGIGRGDVITAVNGVKVVSPAVLYRELRRSLLLESGILTVRRQSESTQRVIYFRDALPAS